MDISGKQGFLSGRIEMRNYRYVQKYRVMNPPNTDGYTVPFTLNYIPGSDPFFRDIQPIANGKKLPFWIEHASGTSITTNTPFVSPYIWIRLPLGCTEVDIYRKNPRMIVDRSNGVRTFDYFEDYNATPNPEYTNIGGSTISGGVLTIGSGGYTTPTSMVWGINSISEVRAYFASINVNCQYRWNLTSGWYCIIGTSISSAGQKQVGGSDGMYNVSWTDAYHIFKILRNGTTNIQLSYDDTSLLTINRNDTALSTAYVGVVTGSPVVYVDWHRVRKYQSPEPTPILKETKTNPLWKGS